MASGLAALLDDVAAIVVNEATRATGAVTGMLALRDAATGDAVMLGETGLPGDIKSNYARFPLTRDTPTAECLRTGQPIFIGRREGPEGLLARYPVIGLLVGILANEGLEWRADARKRRVLTIATLLWLGLFATRLIAGVPLYLAGEVELLGVVKLVLGVPFYAAMLWITWLMVRSVYSSGNATPQTTAE